MLFPGTYATHLLVKVRGDRMQETIAGLQAKWKTLVPYMPFQYSFLDEEYDRLYASERRLGASIIDLVLLLSGSFIRLTLVAITLLTVSVQALRAARVNPVKNLRTE